MRKRKWVGGGLVLALGIVLSADGGFIIGLPALVWGLVLLLGSLRFAALADTKAVLLGFVYGGLASVWCAAAWNLLSLGFWDVNHPYDSGAYAVIQFVAVVLFVIILQIDYNKNGLSRMWVRVLTAMVTLLPAALMALQLMGYFERLLSPLVK